MKLLVLASMLASACGDLESVPGGVCGNFVVEDGEQCDGQDTCGTSGPAACRFTCEREVRECPGELGCSVEGFCVASANRFVDYQRAAHLEMPADQLVAGDLDGDGRDDVIGVGDSLRARFGAAERPLFESYEKRIRPPTGAATIGQLDGVAGLDLVFPTADGIFTLVARGRELDAVPYASATELPDDGVRGCTPSVGWASCQTIDLNGDGRLDRVGFVADRDNVELELGRSAGGPLLVTLDTIDILTDLTVGDLDGDGFGDIAYATRSANGVQDDAVYVVYSAPQPEAFSTVQLLAAPQVSGVAAADLGTPADGVDDLAIARTIGGVAGVAIHLGDSARDLSAPFALRGERAELDQPYAVVAGEFVGGVGSGIDVMAYARNPAAPDRAFLWWLRGLGAAQLTVGAVDPVDTARLAFLDGTWQVGDLVSDLSVSSNGPDEVIGLSPTSETCDGPALTVAVPSARFTATDLLRTVCLVVDGAGWQPSALGLLGGAAPRAVGVATRGDAWWLGETTDLDAATTSHTLEGTELALPASCRGPQLWRQLPDAGTRLSWECDDGDATTIVGVVQTRDGQQTATLATVPRGSAHVVGDFNGDGLTDLAIRRGRELTVLLQCSLDLVGTEGC